MAVNETYTLTLTDSATPTPNQAQQVGTITTEDGTFPAIDFTTAPFNTLEDGLITVDIVLSPSGDTDSFTIDKDTVAPSGYSFTFDEDPIPDTAITSTFTLSGLEVGASVVWSVEDENSNMIGNTFTATQVSENIEFSLSTLDEGQLTGEVQLTDPCGNQGAIESDTTSYGAAFDVDYQAILGYATLQGYTLPSASQQTLQNQLLVDMKATGEWATLDRFSVFATDGDSDFSLIDWKTLTQLTLVNSPTFITDQGWQGDGISAAIDIAPQNTFTNYTMDDASIFGWMTNPEVGGAGIAGNQTRLRVRSDVTPSGLSRINGLNISFTPNPSFGNQNFFGLDRSSSTDVHYYEGATTVSGTNNSSAIDANVVRLLSQGSGQFSSGTIGIYGIGASVFGSESGVRVAIDTYMNAI